VGAAIAEANTLKTGLIAMRLGIVLYIIPFFFLFNPVLIMQGPALHILFYFAISLIGLILVAGGLEGYLLRVGILSHWSRPFLVIAGFFIVYPEMITNIIGFFIVLIVLFSELLKKRRRALRANEMTLTLA
jgi:TRAP-type uncharacterized transport system fused permease subunit